MRLVTPSGEGPRTGPLRWVMLAFFLTAWVAVLAILVVAPDVYDRALRLTGADRSVAEAAFLAALSLFLLLAAAGVVRSWRWTFWSLLVALLAGPLRVLATVLQLMGVVFSDDPRRYIVLQGLIGVVQFAIGTAMLVGYRRRGVIWAAP
ncbi:MAG: hypothetical protein ABR525_06385 [Candidatus Limnocylindria bacterium]